MKKTTNVLSINSLIHMFLTQTFDGPFLSMYCFFMRSFKKFPPFSYEKKKIRKIRKISIHYTNVYINLNKNKIYINPTPPRPPPQPQLYPYQQPPNPAKPPNPKYFWFCDPTPTTTTFHKPQPPTQPKPSTQKSIILYL